MALATHQLSSLLEKAAQSWPPIDQTGLEALFSDAKKQGLAVETRQQDVTNQSTWTATVNGIVKRHGKLDVLFNNAGGGHFALIDKTTLDQ
jgi:NAD(P)-dependent dehydrogenase (short-subunit alcohol dehydrogenase family)